MPVNTPSGAKERLRDLRAALERAAGEVDVLENELESASSSERQHLAEVFVSEVRLLADEDDVDEQTVRRAARIAVAENAWRRHLGTLLRARDVAELLGVTKQRISALTTAGRLIALHAQDGSIGYPAWQFPNGRTSKPLIASYRALSETGGEWSAACWCVTLHPELEQSSPVQWAAAERSGDVLVRVAMRDARRLAE
ncbi:MAG: hypothetical protein ACRD2Z_16305 [Thermoanaerobaculia bacterium]